MTVSTIPPIVSTIPKTSIATPMIFGTAEMPETSGVAAGNEEPVAYQIFGREE